MPATAGTAGTTETTVTRTRLAAAALAVAAAMFVLYPAFRPWQDETIESGALAAMNSGAWVASHTFAMIGFILVPLGLLALRQRAAGDSRTAGSRAEPVAAGAVLASWLGAGLVLPYYGAETFGLYGIASQVATGNTFSGGLLEVVDAVRFQPVAVTTFGLGLLLLGAGGVLAAVAASRVRSLPRASGIPFGLGMVLFLPQFFTPAAVRIGHGILLGAGLLWLAVLLWRSAVPVPETTGE